MSQKTLCRRARSGRRKTLKRMPEASLVVVLLVETPLVGILLVEAPLVGVLLVEAPLLVAVEAPLVSEEALSVVGLLALRFWGGEQEAVMERSSSSPGHLTSLEPFLAFIRFK